LIVTYSLITHGRKGGFSGATYGGSVSVVSRLARRRWVVVVAGTALVFAAPSLAGAAASVAARATSRDATPAPQQLLHRVLASASVAHQGLAESRGTLGLPDVRQFGDVAALLGGTTRERVWWGGPDDWRVARLLTTGEQDLYAAGPGAVVTWDYERNLRRTTVGADDVRLPRPDDLLPPQAARRLLGHLGLGDRVTALPGGRVAGHETVGLRVVPGSAQSTIGSVDVEVDRPSGLPVAVTVRDRQGAAAFESSFLDVDLTAPAVADLAAPMPAGARTEVQDAPDIVALVDRYARGALPSSLADQPRTPGVVRGTATYGRGLARFVVIPLPPDVGDDVLAAARLRAPVKNVPGGQVVVLDAGIVTAAVAAPDAGRLDYLLAGLVTPPVLASAGQALLAPASGEGAVGG
jgi:hypothetical protein